MADSSEDEMLMLAAVLHLKKKKANRRWWVRPWIRRRAQQGAYNSLMRELSAEDSDSYNNFVRMDPQHFQMLLARIEPHITRKRTNMRECISPAERLAVTLRFLATGDSYQSLCFLYRLGRSTIGEIIPDTCRAITVALKDQYLKVPNTTQEWEAIAEAFDEKWNFPHCIGAIDGKHIAIKAPPGSGSMYFNYKDFHSIVLLAVVDAFYRFIWYDVGANGRNNDAGIFASSTLSKALENKTLQVPAPRELANSDVKMPFVLVGDEAFPLKEYLMKPYPQRGLGDQERIFNYRLSRARRVSENAFGILVNRFRVLSNTLNLSPDVVACITESCVALHNFLRTERDVAYGQDIKNRNGAWFRDSPVERENFFTGNHSTLSAREVRDKFRGYFWAHGEVHWQWDEI